MIGRTPRMMLGFQYDEIIEAIDWNRVLIQAYGQHARVHSNEPNPICGACIRSVLLRTEE
jgi:hypothetical protein